MFERLRAANLVRQAEWNPNDKISLSYRGNELAVEVGRACNIIKKIERERIGVKGSRATTQDLADELADVIICVDLIASRMSIDLARAVQEKFNITSTRYGLKTRIED